MKTEITYQAVLFIDKTEEPKFMSIGLLMYDSLKNMWTKEIRLEKSFYSVQRTRAFEVVSEVFGTTYYLIIDVKKKV